MNTFIENNNAKNGKKKKERRKKRVEQDLNPAP